MLGAWEMTYWLRMEPGFRENFSSTYTGLSESRNISLGPPRSLAVRIRELEPMVTLSTQRVALGAGVPSQFSSLDLGRQCDLLLRRILD